MTTDRRWWASAWFAYAVVALVVGGVAFWGLGDRGLTNSEGHRVVPASEFLERWSDGDLGASDVLVPTMFDTAYLRKPPGFPWALAGSMALFGENEWAARSVGAASGVAMALIGVAFGRRWFGCGLSTGLAVGLLPTALSSVRSAEIEGLNNLVTMLGVVCGVSMVFAASRWRWLWSAGFGASIVLVVLVKGPASLPVVGAVPVAGAIVLGWRRVVTRAWVLAVVGAVLVVGLLGWATARAAAGLDGPVVTQGVDEFLFEPGRVLAIAALPLVSVAYQLPVSLAPLFAFGPFATREAARSVGDARRTRVARVLAWAWVLALLVYTLTGVSNPRYTLPAAWLAALCVGYVVRGVVAPGGVGFVPLRRWLGRVSLLGVRWAWLVPIGAFCVGYLVKEEPGRAAESGRDAGDDLGRTLIGVGLGDARVWADDAIEARPEVLWYAESVAARAFGGVPDVGGVQGWWRPGLSEDDLEDEAVLLLRDDERGSEVEAFGAGLVGRVEVWAGEAGPFSLRAFGPRGWSPVER